MSATLSCSEFPDLAAAVALDAAEPLDVQRVERHAEECADCGRQLAAFREVGAALGAAVPQLEPPAAVRTRLFEIVAHTPQERRSRWRLSPAWLAAAASFLVSIVAIAWVAALQGQIATLQREAEADREQTARYAQVVDAMASNRQAIKAMQPVSVSMPSRGIVYLDPSSETGLVMCHNLPPIEQGHAYQIWFVRGNERISGGMLWPDRFGDGYTLIRVPSDVQSFDSVGLTDEPGSGSQWPTTPRVIGTALKESAQ
jgi:PAS domain-containing protein